MSDTKRFRNMNSEYRKFLEGTKEVIGKFIIENSIPKSLEWEIKRLLFELVNKGANIQDVLSGKIIYSPKPDKIYRRINRMLEKNGIIPAYENSSYADSITVKDIINYIIESEKCTEKILDDEMRLEEDDVYRSILTSKP